MNTTAHAHMQQINALKHWSATTRMQHYINKCMHMRSPMQMLELKPVSSPLHINATDTQNRCDCPPTQMNMQCHIGAAAKSHNCSCNSTHMYMQLIISRQHPPINNQQQPSNNNQPTTTTTQSTTLCRSHDVHAPDRNCIAK